MMISARFFRVTAVLICVMYTCAVSSDWPAFHGLDRTNKSKETGLLKKWPDDGPALLWTASGLGLGYSGVSASHGIVYTAGVVDKVNYVFAFDNNGKLLWRKEAGNSWEGKSAFARGFEGSRSTPTVSGGMVYYLSDMGKLTAFDAKTGAPKWSLDIREKYEGHIARYAYSESPLIDGDKLYVAAYGKAGALCLDKKTGKVIWESERLPGGAGEQGDTYAGYTSFVLVNDNGFRQLMSYTADYVYGMNSANGKLLWKVPFANPRHRDNCTDVIYHDGHVFASSGYGHGSMLVKLNKTESGVSAKEVYRTKLMDNHHGGLIFHNGYIYGSGHESKGWFCLDFKTGKQMWNTPGKGSITFAEGMLYLYDENSGAVSLVKAQHEKYELVSAFQVPPGGKGAHWAHPVVSNGVLYLRHADKLYAYNIKSK